MPRVSWPWASSTRNYPAKTVLVSAGKICCYDPARSTTDQRCMSLTLRFVDRQRSSSHLFNQRKLDALAHRINAFGERGLYRRAAI